MADHDFGPCPMPAPQGTPLMHADNLADLLRGATPRPWRVRLDRVLTKQGGGKGEPMQEIVGANGRAVARCTIYAPHADGDLIVRAVSEAAALAKVVKSARAICAAIDAAAIPHAKGGRKVLERWDSLRRDLDDLEALRAALAGEGA